MKSPHARRQHQQLLMLALAWEAPNEYACCRQGALIFLILLYVISATGFVKQSKQYAMRACIDIAGIVNKKTVDVRASAHRTPSRR